MKRQILTLLMLLVFATGAALVAQSTGSTPPPSQQVDETGEPEQGPGPDVDVDAGRNAEDGVMDVDVNRRTDADTAAQGNDPQTGTTGTMGTTTGSTLDDDSDMAGDTDNLPETAGEMPLVGLLGLLSLAGAFFLRTTR